MGTKITTSSSSGGRTYNYTAGIVAVLSGACCSGYRSSLPCCDGHADDAATDISVVLLPTPNSCFSMAAKELLARKTGEPFTAEEQVVLGVTLVTTDGKQQRPLVLYFHDESTAYRQVCAPAV